MIFGVNCGTNAEFKTTYEAFKIISNDSILVCPVYSQKQAKLIRSLGGKIIRIHKNTTPPSSELKRDLVNFEINYENTLANLEEALHDGFSDLSVYF